MRLLFLLPFPPDPEGRHGASRMTGQLVECMAARHEVAAIHLRAPEEPPIAAALSERLALSVEVERPSLVAGGRVRRSGRRALGLAAGRPLWATDWRVSDFDARVREAVRDWRPDIVQAELQVMGQYLAGLATPTVLVDHDPGAATARDLAGWEHGLRRAGRRLDALAWKRYERRILAAADALVTFTERDAAALAPSRPAAVIAPGVALPPQASDPVGVAPRRVLFLGSFGHPPNVDAAVRLAVDVMPTVRERVPDAVLEIVGDAPPAQVRGLAGDSVIVTGRVPDVRPHLDRAAVVAAPLRLGGGTRVKVLDALAAGKALVATPRALAGLPVEPGIHALVADGDSELGEALVELLRDPELRRRLGTAARALAAERLTWERAAVEYEALYASLLA